MSDCCATGNNSRGYDIAVVGAGSAGFSAAITAAEQGVHVALIGHGAIGGTCVNIGCVPSKTLIRAAETLHKASAAKRFAGISARAHAEDWRALVQQKGEIVAGLRQSKYADLLPAYNGLTYVEGKARLAEGGVAVNGDLVKAERVIFTTGARPALPSIPGIEEVSYLTSTSALALETLPKSLLVTAPMSRSGLSSQSASNWTSALE
jgi:mercuric reductase